MKLFFGADSIRVHLTLSIAMRLPLRLRQAFFRLSSQVIFSSDGWLFFLPSDRGRELHQAIFSATGGRYVTIARR